MFRTRMGSLLWIVLSAFTGCAGDLPARAIGDSLLDRPVQNEEMAGSLWDVIPVFGQRYGLPIVAELTHEIPCELRIGKGKATARQILDGMQKRCPNYGWALRGTVVHVYERSLTRAQRNFLNWKIEEITLPKSVADLELLLRSILTKKRAGIKEPGGLIVGLYSTELSQHRLPPKRLIDVTARDVLLSAAGIDRGFLTVVEFPTGSPKTDSDLDAAFLRWRWEALPPKAKE